MTRTRRLPAADPLFDRARTRRTILLKPGSAAGSHHTRDGLESGLSALVIDPRDNITKLDLTCGEDLCGNAAMPANRVVPADAETFFHPGAGMLLAGYQQER